MARGRRLRSAVSIVTTCQVAALPSPGNSCVCASGSARVLRLHRFPKPRQHACINGSVVAKRPVARAKSRTCRGFTSRHLQPRCHYLLPPHSPTHPSLPSAPRPAAPMHADAPADPLSLPHRCQPTTTALQSATPTSSRSCDTSIPTYLCHCLPPAILWLEVRFSHAVRCLTDTVLTCPGNCSGSGRTRPGVATTLQPRSARRGRTGLPRLRHHFISLFHDIRTNG